MDLLCVGVLALDNFFEVTRIPEKYSEGEVRAMDIFFGGRAPNVAANASKLGLKVGLVSVVGGDFISSGYQDHLKRLGVDLTCVKILPEEKTTQILIFTDEKGEQIMFFYLGASAHFRETSVPYQLIKETKMVHITSSNDYEFNVEVSRFAHKNGIRVSFDPGNDPFSEIPAYLRAIIPKVFILFVNNYELSRIFKNLKLNKVRDIQKMGPSIVVAINKEEKSSVIYTTKEKIMIPPVITVRRDPTGASDAYVAGFLTAYLRGYDFKRCGLLASTLSSFVMEKKGAQTNIPSWNELLTRFNAFFKSNKVKMRF